MVFEIKATGRAVPPRRVSNNELPEELDTSDEWIRSHTGIGARHLAEENTASSDLAVEAGRNALAMYARLESAAGAAAAAPSDTALSEAALSEAALSIDAIVLTSATPDFYGSPPTACIVQEKLGAKNACAMDISAGCTGFIYALETAAGLLATGGRSRALVIAAEVLSKFTNWNDRSSCVLFGDGAGAAILEKSTAEGNGKKGLIRSILKADGSGSDYIMLKRGGSRYPFKAGEKLEDPIIIELNGQAVYNFAVRTIVETILEILSQEGISINDISYIIPHQANARIVQAAAKRLKVPESKFYLNIEEYANTSTASIPIALDELYRGGKIRRGDIIMMVGFGAGLTYGANLIVF